MDYLDCVAHLFTPDARAFYRIDKLWGEHGAGGGVGSSVRSARCVRVKRQSEREARDRELKIATATRPSGSRPMTERGRYDLAFEVGADASTLSPPTARLSAATCFRST